MSGGWVQVPGWLLKAKPGANALLVYCTLASFGTYNPGTGRYEECRPALATLAEESGIAENTVRKALKDLLRIGALFAGTPRYDERGGQLPTVYRVVVGSLIPEGGTTAGEGVQRDTPPGVPTEDPPGVPPAAPNQEPNTKNPTPRPSASQRGTRLPEGWRPSDDLLNWAREKAPGVGWVDHEKFVDWARSASGSVAVKKDWDAAWRNWMRRASEQRGARPVSGPPAGQYKSAAEQAIDRKKVKQARAKILDALMESGRSFDQAKAWVENWTDEDFLKAVAPSMAVGYIDGDVIDSEQRPEVES